MPEPRLPQPMRASRPLQDEELRRFILTTLDQIAVRLSQDTPSRAVVEVEPAETAPVLAPAD